jgi:hypothetical protein
VRRKSHRRKHRSRAKKFVWSSDSSDTSSAQDSSVLVNYLVSLSTCPALVPRRKAAHHGRRRRHNHSWDVGKLHPAAIDPQKVAGSNSTSSSETMKSGLGSTGGNFSQDSLDEEEEEDEASSSGKFYLQHMSTSMESDSLIFPAGRNRLPFDPSSEANDSDLERELFFLEQQLVVATQWQESVAKGRAAWIDPSTVVKSWSTELAGNFSGNEKVKFSYENMLSPSLSLLPIRESAGQHSDQSSLFSEPASCYSLPEPVESAVKFLDRVRHNSTHEKFSPRPTRKKLNSDDRSISATSSCCTYPARTHRRSASLSRDYEGPAVAVGGGAGAVGVTSMWIPVTPGDATLRRRFRASSPTPSQSSFCSLPSSTASSASVWSGHLGRIGLARKVFLQHQLLPSKAEG